MSILTQNRAYIDNFCSKTHFSIQKQSSIKLCLICTGGENRTPAKGFGDPRSTTKLHPQPCFAWNFQTPVFNFQTNPNFKI